MTHFEISVRFGKEKKTILDYMFYYSESLNEFHVNPDYLQKLEVHSNT